jgi:hypothetical protein
MRQRRVSISQAGVKNALRAAARRCNALIRRGVEF